MRLPSAASLLKGWAASIHLLIGISVDLYSEAFSKMEPEAQREGNAQMDILLFTLLAQVPEITNISICHPLPLCRILHFSESHPYLLLQYLT